MSKDNKQEVKTNGANLGGIEKDLLKARRKITEISVDIEPSEVFSDAAKYVLTSAERIFRNSNNAPTVDGKILEQYFFDALVHRVLTANTARQNLVLKKRAMNYPLPAIVYNAIRQVGLATDKAFGIRFTPNMTKETLMSNSSSKFEQEDYTDANRYFHYKPLTEDEFDKCVNMFIAMEEEGYVVTGALARELYGDINFMALTNVENTTKGPRSYRDTNPVYAFYRSFFYNQQLSQLCDTIYTYQYNDMDEMANVLKDLVFGRTTVQGLTQVMSEYR